MGVCGGCKFWDITGFGEQKDAIQGRCTLVARHNNYQADGPQADGPMIALRGTEHCHSNADISVITRRNFGCNQYSARKLKYSALVSYKNPSGEGMCKAQIEFEADSNDPGVVRSAHIKAWRTQVTSWTILDVTSWIVFDEAGNIFESKTVEYI